MNVIFMTSFVSPLMLKSEKEEVAEWRLWIGILTINIFFLSTNDKWDLAFGGFQNVFYDIYLNVIHQQN